MNGPTGGSGSLPWPPVSLGTLTAGLEATPLPPNALVFGNWKDPNSRINKLAASDRGYRLLEELGSEPSVVYLKKVRKGQPSGG